MSLLFMALQTQTAEHKMAALAAVLSRNIQTLTCRQVDEESTENAAMNLFYFIFCIPFLSVGPVKLAHLLLQLLLYVHRDHSDY